MRCLFFLPFFHRFAREFLLENFPTEQKQGIPNPQHKENATSNKGAIITMAGKLERMYKLEVGVRSPGSTSFIKIIPLEAVPVRVPKAIKNISCSKPLKHSPAALRM